MSMSQDNEWKTAGPRRSKWPSKSQKQPPNQHNIWARQQPAATATAPFKTHRTKHTKPSSKPNFTLRNDVLQENVDHEPPQISGWGRQEIQPTATTHTADPSTSWDLPAQEVPMDMDIDGSLPTPAANNTEEWIVEDPEAPLRLTSLNIATYCREIPLNAKAKSPKEYHEGVKREKITQWVMTGTEENFRGESGGPDLKAKGVRKLWKPFSNKDMRSNIFLKRGTFSEIYQSIDVTPGHLAST